MEVCERHGRIRCGECSYIEELQEEIGELKCKLIEIHAILLQANKHYTNNNDIMVNYKIREGIEVIESI